MRFGPEATEKARGAILAHSVRGRAQTIPKGTTIGPREIDDLQSMGIRHVVVARLGEGDVGENEAGRLIARLIAGEGIRTNTPARGRVNLFATHAGVLKLDVAAIDGINLLDPAMTVATLPPFAPVAAGHMVATVKIIPYAVAAPSLARVVSTLAGKFPLEVLPYRLTSVGLVSTLTPELKLVTLAKTRRVLDNRLARAGAATVGETRVPHETQAVADSIAAFVRDGVDLVIVFGAAATADEADVIPAAIVAAGGAVERVGMPVDPGNLLVLGSIGGVTVVGAPGCARSPAASGFDMVLNRLLAGIPVAGADMARMGVGGLLLQGGDEAAAPGSRPTVGAIILAAGRGTRFAPARKMLAEFGGRPLVRVAAEAALASAAATVTVVVGHAQAEVRTALAHLPVRIVENPDFAAGVSTSIKAGIACLPADCDGALVMLADMPRVSAALIDRLVGVFADAGGDSIIIPTFGGVRGNPVIWPRRLFPALSALSGDAGGRVLFSANADAIVEVESDGAVVFDVDTPADLAAAAAPA